MRAGVIVRMGVIMRVTMTFRVAVIMRMGMIVTMTVGMSVAVIVRMGMVMLKGLFAAAVLTHN